MKIEELIELSLLYHDIDKEKIRKNILKKTRNKVITKRVLLTIAIAVLVAIPILAISFGFANDNTTLPTEASVTTDTAGAEISIIQSTPSEKVTELFIENNKIIVGNDDGKINRFNGCISNKLLSVFEKHDNDTKFLIKASCVNLVNDSFLYEGKTVNEWNFEFKKAEKAYNDIINGYTDGSAENAKKKMEIAYKRYENAVLSENEYYINIAKGYLAEKNVKIISSDLNERTVLFISSKELVLEMASEEKEKEIEIEFYLGSQDDAIANTVYTVCE